MEFLKFSAKDDDDERRLDKVAFRLLPEKKSGDIFKAIRKGLIKVNNKKVSCDFKIKTADEIEVAEFLIKESPNRPRNKFGVTGCSPVTAECHSEPTNVILNLIQDPSPNDIPAITVLFKNENFLIINKPFDIAVQGGNKNETSLDKIIQKNFPPDASLSFKVGPLHRLDKKTTGVLAFSQSLAGAKWFSEKIKSHEIKKTYIGIVEGKLEKKETWSEKIEEKEALTIATPLKYGTYKNIPLTLVEYEILTGRKHQIRIHSDIHGHPLFGDELHISPAFSKLGGFFLHALKMEFPENDLGLPKVIEAPPPERFEKFLKNIFDSVI